MNPISRFGLYFTRISVSFLVLSRVRSLLEWFYHIAQKNSPITVIASDNFASSCDIKMSFGVKTLKSVMSKLDEVVEKELREEIK